MSDAYSQEMKSFFEGLAGKYDLQDLKRLGFGHTTSQQLRFQALLRIFRGQSIDSNTSILDIGCGLGDFYGYLRDQGYSGKYYGYDLVEENIIAARDKWQIDTFIAGDFLSADIELPEVDYVVASGIFFLPSENWDEIVYSGLEKMYTLSRIGFATNFLSIYSTSKTAGSYYVAPSHIEAMVTKFTRAFMVAHDYLLHDFTIYAWRKAMIEEYS